MKKIFRILIVVIAMIAVTCLVFGCKKDCELRDVENFRIEETGDKKVPCHYVLTGITLEVKDIKGIQNLESEIKKHQALQNSVMYGTPFEYADIKNVRIAFTDAIVTIPANFSIWREFGKLASKFSGVNMSVNQRGNGVCPRDDKTPLEHSEWKQWWFTATTPLQLSANPWSGAMWEVDDKQAFIDDGCDPHQLKVPTKDTISFTVGSLSDFQGMQAIINGEVTKAKQLGQTYIIVDVPYDLVMTGAQKPLVENLERFGTDKATYPDSIFSFTTNGFAYYPGHAGIRIPFTEWKGDMNSRPLKENASNGDKFVVPCLDEQKYKGAGQPVNVFEIDQTDCIKNDTIKISSMMSLNSAPVKIQESLNKPLTNTFVQFVGLGIPAANNSPWESSLSQVLDFLEDPDVTFVNSTDFGGVFPVTDSIDVRGKEVVLNRADQRGLLRETTLTGRHYWYTDEAGKSLMPSDQILRLSSAITSTWRPNNEVTPRVIMDGEFWIGSLPEAYYDGTFPMQVEFVPMSGSNLSGVTQRFCRIISMPAVYDVNKPIQFRTNPQMGRYASNSGQTHFDHGAQIDTLYFGSGTINNGPMFLNSYHQYGNNQHLVRSVQNNVTLVANTTNPAFKDGSNIIWHFDSLYNVSKSIGMAGAARLKIKNISIYLPQGRAQWYDINMGGAYGEKQVCDNIKVEKDANSKFIDNAVDWYRPNNNGYYALPNNSLTPKAIRQFKYHINNRVR